MRRSLIVKSPFIEKNPTQLPPGSSRSPPALPVRGELLARDSAKEVAQASCEFPSTVINTFQVRMERSVAVTFPF